MKEIKAFIHRNRVADVVRALHAADVRHLSVIDVKGLLEALDTREQDYCVEIGAMVITEVKLEVVCQDEDHTAEAVRIILEHGRTGQIEAGWIYISDIQTALPIQGG